MSCGWWSHRWGHWEQYEWQGPFMAYAEPQKLYTKTEQRQRRKCLDCGYAQDELVREG